jgi:hypothetical protein
MVLLTGQRGAGIQVGGSGWANFKSVFATDNGVIYGIQADGKLIWYKHNGYLNGTVNGQTRRRYPGGFRLG